MTQRWSFFCVCFFSQQKPWQPKERKFPYCQKWCQGPKRPSIARVDVAFMFCAWHSHLLQEVFLLPLQWAYAAVMQHTSHWYIKTPRCDPTSHDYVPSWKRWTVPCILCQNMSCPGALYRKSAHHLLTRSSPFYIPHGHIPKQNARSILLKYARLYLTGVYVHLGENALGCRRVNINWVFCIC